MEAIDYFELKQELDQKYDGLTAVGEGFKVQNGQTTNLPAIIIYVEEKKPPEQLLDGQLLPKALLGEATDVIEMKQPYAFVDRTAKFRPAPGGVSVGHFSITAGTLASTVVDKTDGELAFLSNNHVLAASNAGQIGDPCYQPGPADGGTADDVLGHLLRFEPIKFLTEDIPPVCPQAQWYARFGNWLAGLLNSSHRVKAYQEPPPEEFINYVDCAIAKPVAPADLTAEIVDIGTVRGVVEHAVGMRVQKSGRTTELTTGTVQATKVAISVQYGGLKVASFVDQFVVQAESGSFGQPGDSGSLILDENNNATGLLFAGSEATTVCNRIQLVIEALNIAF